MSGQKIRHQNLSHSSVILAIEFHVPTKVTFSHTSMIHPLCNDLLWQIDSVLLLHVRSRQYLSYPQLLLTAQAGILHAEHCGIGRDTASDLCNVSPKVI